MQEVLSTTRPDVLPMHYGALKHTIEKVKHKEIEEAVKGPIEAFTQEFVDQQVQENEKMIEYAANGTVQWAHFAFQK